MNAPRDESLLLVDSIPGLVALLSTQGAVEFVNRQILEYTGKSLEELQHWGTNDTVHAEDLPHVIRAFTESIASGTPYEILQRLRRGDGAYRWFQNSGFPLRDAHGRIVRWCVLLTDVDERKHAEDALRASERESRLIVDSIPGLVVTLTSAGAVDAVNQPLLEYFGKPLEEVQQWAVNDILHPDDRERIIELFNGLISSGGASDWEARIRRFDGAYRWFQIRGLPHRDAGGQTVRWYVLLTDIDDLKRAEEDRRRVESELRQAYRTQSDARCRAPTRTSAFAW